MSHACHRSWNCCKIHTRCRIHCGIAPATRNDAWASKSGPNMWCFKIFNHVDLETCFAPQQRAPFKHLNFQTCSENGVLWRVYFDLKICLAPQWRHLNLQKCSEAKAFSHFDLEMRVAPQRRTFFEHLNFQKWFETTVFWAFWLQNRQRAIFHLVSAQMAPTRRFSEPTFRPAGATRHWKKSASRLFHIFAHFDLLSTDSFSLDSFSSPTPLTTVAALAHKSEVRFLTSFDYVVYWSNSIYIVANRDDDHNGRGVEPSKLWYRWPMFSWNNKKEPGEKNWVVWKPLEFPTSRRSKKIILHQADSNGRIWYGLSSGDLK